MCHLEGCSVLLETCTAECLGFESCLEEASPRPQKPVKQPYLSDATMVLVHDKGKVLAKFNTVGHMIKHACIWFCVRVWKASVPGRVMWMPVWRPARGPVTPQLCLKRNDLGLTFDLMEVQVNNAVASDFGPKTLHECGSYHPSPPSGSPHRQWWVWGLVRCAACFCTHPHWGVATNGIELQPRVLLHHHHL